jgi:hypothetical protein
VVTVHTDFTDLNQMAQGLVGRVNETHVILPGPDPVDAGEWVQFAVTLYDGTPGFAGVGRCVTVVDNGEERLSHQRFDVVIDALQFDTRGQQIFEHILALTSGETETAPTYADAEDVYSEPAPAYEPQTSEDASGVVDVSAEFVSEPPPAYDAGPAQGISDDEATVIGDRANLEAALSLSALGDDAMPTQPPPAGERRAVPQVEVLAPVNGTHYTPKPVNGYSFKYPDGLPFPSVPPRPELDPARRVTPAPRPRA